MVYYQINEQLRDAIEFSCNPETGEVDDIVALEDLEMERDEKIESVCLYIKNLKAEAAAIKAEKDALDARMKASVRKAESLTNYLQQTLAGEKFKTPRCAVSYRKIQAVRVFDPEALPADYIRVRTSMEPNRVMIKDAIKAGMNVPGAELEERQSMMIKGVRNHEPDGESA